MLSVMPYLAQLMMPGNPSYYEIKLSDKMKDKIKAIPELQKYNDNRIFCDHVTLWYRGHKRIPDDQKDDWESLSLMQTMKVTGKITGICIGKIFEDDSDFHVVCLKVDIPDNIPCKQKQTHITYALCDNKKIRPYHSNKLLDKEHTFIPMDMEFTGVINGVYFKN